MAKKLALTLIVAGAIGALAGAWNMNNSSQISERIKSKPQYCQYSQLTDIKTRLIISSDPEMKINSAYGGGSAAIAVVSGLAVLGGGYLLRGKNLFDSK